MDWKDKAALIWKEHPSWGRKNLHQELTKQGYTMGITSVQRWMYSVKKKGQIEESGEAYARKIERENSVIRRELVEAQQALRDARTISDILKDLDATPISPPSWTQTINKTANRGIATAPLTDTHFDEVVNPEEIEYLNCYNREIGLKRLKKWSRNVCALGMQYFDSIHLDGFVVPLMGDILSGDIHEELKETNESTVIDSALYWVEHLAAAVNMISEIYGKVYVPCVVGNHGRTTRKPRHKSRVKSNMDYLVYAMLAKHYFAGKDVTIDVSPSSDIDWKVYGTCYRATHGDQFRGGSGIAAALSPMMLGDARKRKKASVARRPYDFLLMGHWHQLLDFKGIIACPSLKGYDEFASDGNFEPSEPGGYFWIDDPERGRTLRAPVHVIDNEDWGVAEEHMPIWMIPGAA